MGRNHAQLDFVMIKPSHYDDDGYPIVWWKTILPSNSLAALNGLARDAASRQVLGPGVGINLIPIDECNRHVVPARIVRATSPTSSTTRSTWPGSFAPPGCR
jgi:hypothetical protein